VDIQQAGLVGFRERDLATGVSRVDGNTRRMLGLQSTDPVDTREQMRAIIMRQRTLAAAAADLCVWRQTVSDGAVALLPPGGHPYPIRSDGRTDPDQVARSVPPQDRPVVDAARDAVRRSTGPVEARYRVLQPDGPVRHLLTRRVSLRDADSAVNEILGVAIDVTPRDDSG